jgi:predicted GNAT superfamily acetyltransferase
MEIDISTISQKEDILQIHILQQEIYQFEAEDMIPYHTLVTIIQTGGYILKATFEDKIIAYSILTVGDNEAGSYLYLYMIGVLEAYKKQGVAFKLMQEHKSIAKSKNINIIQCSFNPYSLKLANFYLNKCGAELGSAYKEGLYTSTITEQLDTDRVFAIWNILSDDQNNQKYNVDLSSFKEINQDTPLENNLLKTNQLKLTLPSTNKEEDQGIVKKYRMFFSNILLTHKMIQFQSTKNTGIYYFSKE